jgi:hypothetical protein
MRVLALTAVVALLTVDSATADDVKIGINIGVPAPPPVVIAAPPPPVIVTAPPQVVVVPGSTVYYAPNAGINFFVYGGQ